VKTLRENYSEMSDYHECEHLFSTDIDGRTVCNKCGLMMEAQLEYGFDQRGTHSNTSGSKTSVLDAVKGVPEEVKIVARASMNRKGEFFIKKVRDDKKNTFKEIYVAYQKMKIKFDPIALADELGLGRKEINCCLKSLSGTSLTPSIHDDEEHCSIAILHPADEIADICRKNNLEEHIEEFTKISRKIVDNKDNLLSCKPHHIACAIVRKCCEKKGIPLKSFGKKNNLSDSALKKATRKVEEFFE